MASSHPWGQRRREPINLYLGLNNACKNFLVGRLNSFGSPAGSVLGQHGPMRPREEFIIRGTKFKPIDLGDPRIARRVWKDYPVKVDAVVYIVTAERHPHRFPPIAQLNALLADEALAYVPLLVLVKDPSSCFGLSQEDSLRWNNGLQYFQLHLGPVKVLTCTNGDLAHEDGFEWLSQRIEEHINQRYSLVLSERMMDDYQPYLSVRSERMMDDYQPSISVLSERMMDDFP